MKVSFVRFLPKFRGTCRSHAPLMSSFRPKLQRRNEARRLSNGIKSKRNVHPATGKTNTLSFESFWSKTLVQRFLPRCMRYGENFALELWRPVFRSVYLMYTADVKYLNGYFFLLKHHENSSNILYVREKKYESSKCCQFHSTRLKLILWNKHVVSNWKRFLQQFFSQGIPPRQRGMYLQGSFRSKNFMLTDCRTCKPL